MILRNCIRLGLVRAMLMCADILLLDEPTGWCLTKVTRNEEMKVYPWSGQTLRLWSEDVKGASRSLKMCFEAIWTLRMWPGWATICYLAFSTWLCSMLWFWLDIFRFKTHRIHAHSTSWPHEEVYIWMRNFTQAIGQVDASFLRFSFLLCTLPNNSVILRYFI